MAVCALQTGHVGDASQESVGITNMNFKQCTVQVKEETSKEQLLMIVLVSGASALIVLILVSGLIYRYYCGYGPSSTP